MPYIVKCLSQHLQKNLQINWEICEEEASKSPLLSRSMISQNLLEFAQSFKAINKMRKGESQPSLNKKRELECQEWITKYLKAD